MDFKTWLFVALALWASADADPSSKIPQKPAENNPESNPPQQPQKRHGNYEMKEMIVYLTPTQIKDIESGKAVLQHQYNYPETNQYQQQELREMHTQQQNNQQLHEQLQNSLHEKGQELQRLIKDAESEKVARLQHQEVNQAAYKPQAKEPIRFQEEPKPQQFSEYQPQYPQELNYLQEAPKHEIHQQIQPQLQYQSISHITQQESQIPQQWQPDNYAQQYSYPHGELLNNVKSLLFEPEAQQPKLNEQIPFQHFQQDSNRDKWSLNSLPTKFQWIPYEYNPEAKLEAQKLLENEWAALEARQLNIGQVVGHQWESQQLKEVNKKFSLTQTIPQHQNEIQQLQNTAQHLGSDEFDAIRQHSENVQALQKKAIEKLTNLQSEFKDQQKRMKAQQKEAQRLDAELEKEEYKTEVAKAEEKFFGSLNNQGWQKNQNFNLFTPMLQPGQIKNSLKLEKPNIFNPPKLEGGFKPLEYTYSNNEDKPLQYAPKFNEERYITEFKQSLEKNEQEYAKAIAKAAAITKQSPLSVHEDVKITRPLQVLKHVSVPVPNPFYVRLPSPFEVKVPEPYPVPLEIIRHVPVPVVKTEKIEVDKPVPFEVEKHVTVPVTKSVYFPVEKPYYVRERVVPVEIEKEIPVEKIIHRPEKYTIVKHVWKH